MMEEIQDILKAIAGLPSLALWAIFGLWLYKIIVVGSIYGVIKHSLDVYYKATLAKHEIKLTTLRELGLTITNPEDEVKETLQKLISLAYYKGEEQEKNPRFIHLSDLQWAIKKLRTDNASNN